MLQEWKRIVFAKRTLTLASLLLAVNLLLFFYASGDPLAVRSQTRQYEQLLGEIQNGTLSREALEQDYQETEVLLRLFDYRSFRQASPQEYALGDAQMEQQLRSQYPQLAETFDRGSTEEGELRQKWIVLDTLLDSIGYEDVYRERLSRLRSNAGTMAAVGIFQNQNSRSNRNIQKTAEDYASLEKVHITPGNDRSTVELLGYGVPPLLGIFFAMALVSRSREEQDYGLRPLVFVCKNGRGPLMLWRSSALLLSSGLFAAVLYGTVMLADVYLYGGVDWNRSVQSVPELFSVKAPMTLGQLWGLYLAWGIGAQLMVMALTWCLFSLLEQRVVAVSVLVGLMGLAGLLYWLIPGQSVFSALKYANPAAALDPGNLLTIYENVQLGPLLVENDAVAAAAMTVTLLLTLPAAIWRGIRHSGTVCCLWFQSLSGLYHRFISCLPPMGIEVYKVLVIHRGGLLLLALVLILSQGYRAKSPAYVGTGEYMHNFYARFEGSGITRELLDYVQELETELAQVEEQWQQASQAFQSGNLRAQEYEMAYRRYEAYEVHRQGLQTVYDRMDYLSQQTHPAVLVDPTGYDRLLQETSFMERMMDWVSVFSAMALCASCFQVEEKAGLRGLLRSTRYGRGRLALRKTLLGLCLSGLVYGLMVFFKARSVTEAYGLTSLGAPVHSLPFFRDCPLTCSIGWALLWYLASGWLVYGFFGSLVYLLSELLSCEWAVCLGALGAIGPELCTLLGWRSLIGLRDLKDSASAWMLRGNWGLTPVWLLLIILFTGLTCLLWKRRIQ